MTLLNSEPCYAGSGGQRAGTLALLEALRRAADGAAAAAHRPGSGPAGEAANASADDEEQLLLDSQARFELHRTVTDTASPRVCGVEADTDHRNWLRHQCGLMRSPLAAVCRS